MIAVDRKLRSPAVGSWLEVALPFFLGMSLNLLSIVVGDPYLVSLSGVVVASVATIAWSKRPLPWIVLASVVAANPVNLSASISLNLIFALVFLLLNMRSMNRLPKTLLMVTAVALLSVLGSIVNWNLEMSLETFFNQGASVINYLLGPFFLIPLIFIRLRNEHNSELLLRGFVFGLLVPTVTLLAVVHFMGYPVSDFITTQFDYLVNVSMYRLGKVDFSFTRTQVGIVLAALICASFAVVIVDVSRFVRLTAVGCLVTAAFLLFVTGSVGSILAGICGLGAILIAGKRYLSLTRFLLIAVAVGGLFYSAWFTLPYGVQKYVESRYTEKLSGGKVDVSDRSFRWEESFRYLMENPIGVGWALYVEPIRTYPHNDYLTYGIAYGIFSGFLYLFVPGWLLWRIVASRVHDENPSRYAVQLSGIGVTTVLLINSFSDHLTANRWYFNVVWSLVWYAFFIMNSPSPAQRLKESRVIRLARKS